MRTSFGVSVAPRILLIGVTVIGAAHLTAPLASAQGLVAAYSFDEGSGTSVRDASGSGNGGTVSNATWTTAGRLGGALVFNGSSALVTVPGTTSLRLSAAMTLEAWVKPTAVDSLWRDVIYKGSDDYYLEATSTSSARPAAGGTFAPDNVYGSSAIPVNAWTHLAATYDGATLKLYVNGTLASSTPRVARIAVSGGPLQIGGDSGAGQYFAGAIDEVRIYSTAISEAQIRADMTTPIGAGGQTPAPAPAPTSPADLTLTKTHVGSFTQGQTGAYTLTVRNNGAGATSGTVTLRDYLPAGLTAAGIAASGWTCTVSSLTCTRGDALASGASYPTVTVTVNVSTSAPSSVTNTATVSGGGESNTANSSASDVTAIASVVSPSPSPAPQPGQGLVAAYSFDEGAGSVAQDASSGNNDGKIRNASWTPAGRLGGALVFNGTNALVNIPSTASLRLTSAMTLEAWVKPTTVNAQWRDVIYKGNDDYYLEGMSTSSARPAAGGTFAPGNVYGASAIPVNTWTHLAATYDGATLRMYVNGVQVSSASRTGSINTSNGPLQIGGDSGGGQNFAGTIDEVRVYDIALTAADIQSDMTTPIGSPLEVAPLPPPSSDTTPPSAVISSPIAGAQVSGSVTITANASDNVGVASVTFLVDGTSIGSDTTAPYGISWNTAAFAAGPHSLQAQARDAVGNVGMSAAVGVSIAAANGPPSITMLSPMDGAVMQAPATITVSASVTDGDGTVARVDFYCGSTLIGSRTAAPFTVDWTAGAAGAYSFVVTAVDNNGASSTSAPVTVTVDSSSSGTAMFTPSSDDSIVSRYVLEIFTDGVNVNTAAPVANADLGKPSVVNGEYAADISATLASLPNGTYIATVTAEAAGGNARSAPSPAFAITTGAVSSLGSPTTVTTSAMPAAAPGDNWRTAPAAPESAAEGTLWVTSASAHMVTAFDAATGDVLATIPVGARPVAIAAPVGGSRIYVADQDSDTVSVIDKATMTRAGVVSLPAPSGRKPHRLTQTADGSRVFVSERGSNVVDVIDTATDQLVARFAAGRPGTAILAAIPDAAGQLVYALSRGDDVSQNALAAIDAATGRWVWVMPIAEVVGDLTLEPDARTALVSVPAKNAILFIDLERHALTRAVDLGAGNEPATLRTSSDGHVVVMLEESPDRVGIIDQAANVRLVRLVDVSMARSDRSDARLLWYIPSADESGVAGVDPASGALVRRFRLPGGGSASDAAFDPK
ncbi:MAG TPA: LamG-like jellyroll fold domain-containing protein [Vicinamibacterales bacterium]|nr:LamG-like jellyroll fold domain-containing protein [Vicinamibacterales bacterium]